MFSFFLSISLSFSLSFSLFLSLSLSFTSFPPPYFPYYFALSLLLQTCCVSRTITLLPILAPLVLLLSGLLLLLVKRSFCCMLSHALAFYVCCCWGWSDTLSLLLRCTVTFSPRYMLARRRFYERGRSRSPLLVQCHRIRRSIILFHHIT